MAANVRNTFPFKFRLNFLKFLFTCANSMCVCVACVCSMQKEAEKVEIQERLYESRSIYLLNWKLILLYNLWNEIQILMKIWSIYAWISVPLGITYDLFLLVLGLVVCNLKVGKYCILLYNCELSKFQLYFMGVLYIWFLHDDLPCSLTIWTLDRMMHLLTNMLKWIRRWWMTILFFVFKIEIE